MENNPKSTKTKKSKRKVIDSVIIVFLCLVLVGSVSGFFILSRIIAKVSDIDSSLEDKITNVTPTEVYAANGKKIEERGQETREVITYEQLPQVTIDAFLAIEDSRYFSHNGFDLPRFISSAFTNLRSGSLAQGGSTLTMQTIDNYIIKPMEEAAKKEGKSISTLERIESKIQEIYLSMRLESKMDKEEILTFYLNKVNFGSSNNSRGIQKGAQYYFGKNVEELNLSESAFLAGVVNAPAYYNPYKGYSKEYKQNYYQYATERRNETLQMMLYHGYITESEYKLALSTKLAFQLEGEPEQSSSENYSGYVEQAIQEASELTGMDPSVTPMKIYTALDTEVQDQMNSFSQKEDISLPSNPYFQIASVVMNNQTGEIIAINDGFNDSASTYRSRSMVDRHQTGSTMKPILEYALAFENSGWATSRVIEDEKMDVNGHVIVNYDSKYHGKVSLERAIAQSLNVPAVKTMLTVEEDTGVSGIIQYLKNLGFEDEIAEKYDYQYAIGAGNMEATPAQMAAAFSVLANGGYYIQPHMVTKIEFKDGSRTIENNPQKEQVLSAQAAYMVSDLLYKAVNGEYKSYNFMGSRFSGCGYPVYGKTGTSDWGSLSSQVGGSRKDGWMVNYTSQYTIASWNGFDQRVDGYSYITSGVQNMDIPGQINRTILNMLSSSAYKIQNPGGLSSYGGGLIKTEDLKNAKENNPETEEQMKDYKEELEKEIDKLKSYDSSKYTEETWKLLQDAIAEAQKAASEEDLTEEKYKELISKLQNAAKGLKEKEAVNTAALQSVITNAQSYMDTTKYSASAVANLQTAVNSAKLLLSKADATQQEIDAAVQNINSLISACQSNPITGTTPDSPQQGQGDSSAETPSNGTSGGSATPQTPPAQ